MTGPTGVGWGSTVAPKANGGSLPWKRAPTQFAFQSGSMFVKADSGEMTGLYPVCPMIEYVSSGKRVVGGHEASAKLNEKNVLESSLPKRIVDIWSGGKPSVVDVCTSPNWPQSS